MLKKHTGKTMSQVVIEARMAYAVEQLAMSTKAISTISLECGMNNLSYFYKTFRERWGVTPRQFRLQKQVVVR